MREVLRVSGLVEERAPVLRAAGRLDHEDDAAGDLDRHAERARRLLRPVLEIELDVALRAQVDAEVGEARFERRNHARPGERGIPVRAAPRARDVPTLRLAEAQPDASAQEAVAGVLPQALRRVEKRAALIGERIELEAEAAVQVGVRLCAEARGLAVDHVDRMQVQRVEVLLGQVVTRLFEPLAPPAVGLVHDRGPQVAVRDRLAVDLGHERRLELGGALGLVADEVAEVALAGEAPQLARVAVPVHRGPDGERGVELRQLCVPLVDRGQLVAVLEAGEVEVRLLVQLGDEAIGVLAQVVELTLAQRLGHRGS